MLDLTANVERKILICSSLSKAHPKIESSKEAYFATKKEDQRMLEEKACQYSQHDCQGFGQTGRTPTAPKSRRTQRLISVLSAHWSTIQLTVDALKLQFQWDKAPGVGDLVLLEQKRKTI